MIPRAIRRILAPQPWEFCTPLAPADRLAVWKARRAAAEAMGPQPEALPEIETAEQQALRLAAMDRLREQAAEARRARRARKRGDGDGSDS